ncbi:hypothetical protein MARHY1527 [Marinobacter nauticus ATCC 49840]|nr:hypothetical protein MARHY1527 [Marinobacter nauticus ATCC 49840]
MNSACLAPRQYCSIRRAGQSSATPAYWARWIGISFWSTWPTLVRNSESGVLTAADQKQEFAARFLLTEKFVPEELAEPRDIPSG